MDAKLTKTELEAEQSEVLYQFYEHSDLPSYVVTMRLALLALSEDETEEAINHYTQAQEIRMNMAFNPNLDVKTFYRKPFEVQAVRVTNENMKQVADWCNGEIDEKESAIEVEVMRPLNKRQRMAYVGDWVLSSPTGFKVYQDKPFSRDFQSQ